MKKIYILKLVLLLFSSCTKHDGDFSNKYQLVLKDSLNLSTKDIHLISVFNQSKVSGNHGYLVDLLGGQVFGFNEGREMIFDLRPNEIGKIDFAYQPGNIAIDQDNYFILLPASGRILHFDKNKKLIKVIMFISDNNLTIDKSAPLFQYNSSDSTFYVTISKEAPLHERYKKAPLVGKYSYDGKLLQTYSSYPEHYNDIKDIKDLNPWKYSFFDFDETGYYAVFNKYNAIHKFDKDFKLIEKLQPNLPLINQELGSITKLGSFKKHPTKNLFFIDEAEYLKTANNKKAVKVRLKWYDSDSGEVGYFNMKNFFSLFQVIDDGTIVILDKNSHEDAYFYFYRLEEVAPG